MSAALIHLLRHGEVYNPEKILYGRLPGFGLSDLGHKMAQMAYNEFFQNRDIACLASSPLQRARETAEPAAKGLELELHLDDRIIEAQNHLEGLKVTQALKKNTKYWKYLCNPFKPSWGESYKEITTRMYEAITDAAEKADGREALLISHQLPIWLIRLEAERKKRWHNPTKRKCSLASVTSLYYNNGTVEKLEYNEPALPLLGHAKTIPGA